MRNYLGGLMGFVIGDILGFPLSGKTREELLKEPVTKLKPFDDTSIEEGAWSNNTSLLLTTIDSINAKCAIDYEDMMIKLSIYKNHASYTPLGIVLDIDRTTARSIDKYIEEKENPLLCGVESSTNNKSLMRVFPLSYYAIDTHLKELEILDLVKKVSSLTHPNEECRMACYIYVRFAMFLINGKDKLAAYNMTKAVDYTMFTEDTRFKFDRLLKNNITDYKLKDIVSDDNVVNTLETVIWVLLNANNYKESIIGSINLGDDTSSIGALVGALAGILYGYESIPEEWLDKIIKKDYIMDIFEEFCENKY
jgi:ADP-ribosylglycohydrolase